MSLAVVTKEFRCVFQLFFRSHLYLFYSVVALKVEKSKPFEWHAYLFTATLGFQICSNCRLRNGDSIS